MSGKSRCVADATIALTTLEKKNGVDLAIDAA